MVKYCSTFIDGLHLLGQIQLYPTGQLMCFPNFFLLYLLFAVCSAILENGVATKVRICRDQHPFSPTRLATNFCMTGSTLEVLLM